MSKRADPPPGVPGAGARRARYTLQSAALLLAVIAICAFLGLLASRTDWRIDTTSTGEHQLSERTLSTLNRLDAEYEVVVATNFAATTRQAVQRTSDVLDAIDTEGGERLRTTFIDTGSASGLEAFTQLVDRLHVRYADEIDTQQNALAEYANAARALADEIASIGESFDRLRVESTEETPNAKIVRDSLGESAAICRLLVEALRQAAARTDELLESTLPGTSMTPIDDARTEEPGGLISIFRRAAAEIRTFEGNLSAFSDNRVEGIPPNVRDAAPGLAERSRVLRDIAAREAAAIEDLPTIPLFAVVRLLAGSSALVVIGPTDGPRGGLTADTVDSLFPATSGEGATGVDLRFRTEQIITKSIATLTQDDLPVVVFVHAQLTGTPGLPTYRMAYERLSLRGIDVLEWNVASTPDHPAVTRVDPTGRRPVVHIVVPNRVVPTDPRTAQLMGQLSNAASELFQAGRSMLILSEPSSLPAQGAPDPMVEFLEPIGLRIDTAHPLLRQVASQRGRTVVGVHLLTDHATEHAVMSPLRGLRLHLDWPVPIDFESTDPTATFTPLIEIDGSDRSWGESEWTRFFAVPQNQRPLVSNPPQPGGRRDRSDAPWVVGAAVERSLDGAVSPQRLVVVGANGWLSDRVARQTQGIVDGKPILVAPANLELLESSIFWLAGQDEMIARSELASAVPTIRSLTPRQLGAIRWSLIAGLPALVLLIGAMWRVVRG